jgi:hypothetical protein
MICIDDDKFHMFKAKLWQAEQKKEKEEKKCISIELFHI